MKALPEQTPVLPAAFHWRSLGSCTAEGGRGRGERYSFTFYQTGKLNLTPHSLFILFSITARQSSHRKVNSALFRTCYKTGLLFSYCRYSVLAHHEQYRFHYFTVFLLYSLQSQVYAALCHRF